MHAPKPARFPPSPEQRVRTINYQFARNTIYNTDCVAGMSIIPDHSVQLILCDLPYGRTNCAWDKLLPLDALWQQWKRILAPGGVVALTAIQPFTTDLIQSNRPWFRYCWYWRKNHATGFTFCKKQPMRCIEDVAIFYPKPPDFHPQGLVRLEQPLHRQEKRPKAGQVYAHGLGKPYVQEFTHYPTHLLEIPCQRGLHPTQKPVELFAYLIRSYTNPGDLVLDACMGSGTTAVACIQTGRDYVGFELDEGYWQLCQQRVQQEREAAGGQARVLPTPGGEAGRNEARNFPRSQVKKLG